MSDLARTGSYLDGFGHHVEYLQMRCPGCDDWHQIVYRLDGGDATWEWNGSTTKPTISPSILVQGKQWVPPVTPDNLEEYKRAPWEQRPVERRCHSFVRDGQWQFLSDSTHPLAGQTVPMVPLTDRWPDGRDLTESN